MLFFRYAPLWDDITKDDDVRFFPRDSPSVIGQELLERGFPQDAASSQVVIVYERADAPLTPADFSAVEDRAADFHKFSQANPELGVKKIDTHRSPVIGPRLIGKDPDGPGPGGADDRLAPGHLSLQEDADRRRRDPRSTSTRAPPCPPGCVGR